MFIGATHNEREDITEHVSKVGILGVILEFCLPGSISWYTMFHVLATKEITFTHPPLPTFIRVSSHASISLKPKFSSPKSSKLHVVEASICNLLSTASGNNSSPSVDV